jgi:hypothetical protein
VGSKRARQRGSEAPAETARKRPQKAEARRPNRAAGRGFGRASRNATFPSLRSAQSVVGEGRESGLSKTRHGILIALGPLAQWQGIDARESESAGAARKEEEWAQTGPPRSQDKGRLQAAEAAARATTRRSPSQVRWDRGAAARCVRVSSLCDGAARRGCWSRYPCAAGAVGKRPCDCELEAERGSDEILRAAPGRSWTGSISG